MIDLFRVVEIKTQYHNGSSSVKGETSNSLINKKVPFAPVKLFDQSSNKLLDITLTDKNGKYEFNNLSNTYEYFIVFHDPEKILNGVIADNIGGGRDMDE